ncbi:hypothetical protein HDU92_001918 [Lobulomyces angularis]|nr:hypothetical protein HDU92_001918 [Lobulomyces angularis]
MTNSITKPQSAHIESLKPGILDMAPTKAELENVSLALEKLWLMDDNKLVPEKDFELNLQKYTYVSAQEDKAFEPLFKKTFDETKIFKSKKNFQHFINLLDNYTYLTGVKETNLKSHEKEEELFLSFILKTKPMLYLFHYLCELKIFKKEDLNNGVFLNKLKVVWFQNYKRVVKDDSSAFEHTFVGEIRDGAVIGFHNWVQFYLEEKRGHADYMGYIRPRDRSQKSSASDQILSIHLKWHNVIKPVSTLFIGTSPELEIAMYSLLFFTKNQNVKVTFDNVNLIFKIHTFNSPEGLKLGSCYVETY